MRVIRRICLIVAALWLVLGCDKATAPSTTDRLLATCPQEVRKEMDALREKAEPIKSRSYEARKLTRKEIQDLETALINFRSEMEAMILPTVAEKKHPACRQGLRNYVEGLMLALHNLPLVFPGPAAVNDSVWDAGEKRKSRPVSR